MTYYDYNDNNAFNKTDIEEFDIFAKNNDKNVVQYLNIAIHWLYVHLCKKINILELMQNFQHTNHK